MGGTNRRRLRCGSERRFRDTEPFAAWCICLNATRATEVSAEQIGYARGVCLKLDLAAARLGEPTEAELESAMEILGVT